MDLTPDPFPDSLLRRREGERGYKLFGFAFPFNVTEKGTNH